VRQGQLDGGRAGIAVRLETEVNLFPGHPRKLDAPLDDLQARLMGNEQVDPILWQTNSSTNDVQNLVMVTLKAMTHQSLPEVFGHNKPLYIADKIAKAQLEVAMGVLEADK
jgi:hypothetical protein